MKASDVKAVQAVIRGDHGDMAFQFGAVITAELQDGEQLHFKVCCCKLVCSRNDTSAQLETTILPRLTIELEVISMQALYLYSNADDQILCSFTRLLPIHINHDTATIQVNVFITGNLAFQAIRAPLGARAYP